jgi:hypothetical protein
MIPLKTAKNLFAPFCGYSLDLPGMKAYQSKSNQIKPLELKWLGVSGEWLERRFACVPPTKLKS